MSGTTKSTTSGAAGNQRWAALDKQNERLVDASHPLLAELRRQPADLADELPAAS
ncbi:MAG TPA: hypothetical protein VLX31_11290 [Streptosporangiaceae bacterium]|nr:hypothetical protein [Streptosporangiaceae bacterium]